MNKSRVARICDGLKWLLPAVLIAWVYIRIRTFVTGQDPVMFIALARKLLEAPLGSDLFRETVFYTAPGYPLILALAIKLFGAFAPYYVNPVIGLLFFWIYTSLLRDLFSLNGMYGIMVFLLTFAGLVFGFRLNPYFLFYPFREMPIYLAAFLAFYLLQKAETRRSSTWLWFLGGLVLLFALGLKETMVFVAVGPLLWLLARKAGGRKDRLLPLLWAWLPFLLLLVPAGLALFYWGDRLTSFQFDGWLVRFKNKSPQEMMGNAVAMLGFLRDEVSLVGCALMLWGLWTARRNSKVWFFFVIPAVLSFLFLCTYISHRRYFLVVLVLLYPLLCNGALSLLKSMESFFDQRARRFSSMPFLLLATGLLCFIAWHSVSLQPWGPRVSRSEVKRFLQTVEKYTTPGDRVLSEDRCRYLRDVVGTYSPLQGDADVWSVDNYFGNHEDCYYFKPLTPDCFYSGTIDGHEPAVLNESILKYRHYDVLPVRDDQGRAVLLEIAGGPFELCRVIPFGRERIERKVLLKQGSKTVFWLDFQENSEGPARTVRVRSMEGDEWGRWILPPGASGLQGILLNPGQAKGHAAILEVESKDPISEDMVYTQQIGDTFADFRTDQKRTLSTDRWFDPPFDRMERIEKYAGVFDFGGRLRLPPVYGPYGAVGITLILSPAPARVGGVDITYETASGVTTNVDMDLNALNYHSLLLSSNDFAAGYVNLRVNPPDCLGSKIRVHMVRLNVKTNEDNK